jgi:hypothetical protein
MYKKNFTILFLWGASWTTSVEWSEFLATDPEARVRFPALPEKKSSRSETS